jgi:hypothetical protein
MSVVFVYGFNVTVASPMMSGWNTDFCGNHWVTKTENLRNSAPDVF